MKRTSLSVAVLAACVASGCSTLPNYPGPAAGEPTAIVDTSRVQPTAICTNGTLYQVGPARDNRLAVPANGRVALYHFVYIDDYNVSYSCNPGISFRPASGQTYLFNLEIEDQRCRVEVYREGAKNRTGLDIEWSVGGPQFCKATSEDPKTLMSVSNFVETGQPAGAVLLPSGVRYVVVEKGIGKKPGVGTLEVELRGETNDGKVFVDSATEGKPLRAELADFPLPGLREVLALMPAGSRWDIYLPSEQAFGDAPNSPIGPGQAVKFTVKLNSVE